MKLASWDELLAVVASGPRENGSAALEESGVRLAAFLREAGLETQLWSYMAQPYRLRLAGMFALAASVVYAAMLLRRRPAAALLVAVAAPAAVVAELDFYLPLLGWVGATPQMHIAATLPGRQPTQHLIVAAHYDSKTDLLDHVERAPVELLALPVAVFMVIAAVVGLWRVRFGARGAGRVAVAAAVLAVINGLGLFASLTAGALVSGRSHGALDDGAACAVLVRLAQKLASTEPLQRTDLTVLLLSGEEIGVYGSWVYVREMFARPPDRPTAVINLEFFGATQNLGVFGREAFALRSFEPDARLVALLDEVHRRRRGVPLYRFPYPAATDARSFLAHGVAAATLYNDLPGHALARHLHTAGDRRPRIDLASLDEAVEYIEEAARLVDRRGL